MRIICTILIVCLSFLQFSCSTVKPPVRPVAYMFPSVMPASSMAHCHPCNVSFDKIEMALEQAHIMDDLKKHGMRDDELFILARGISKRGYGEVDARRSGGEIVWVAVFGVSDEEICVVTAFREKPAQPIWPDGDAELVEIDADAYDFPSQMPRYEIRKRIKLK